MPLLPDHASISRIKLPVVIIILLTHLGAVAALFAFSWTGVGIAVALCYATGALGITLGYHRLLTHGSFRCHPWTRYVLTILGCLALQGGPVSWVAYHRLHHKGSDHAPDPHSPKVVNFLWSHMLWLFWSDPGLPDEAAERAMTRDLLRDRGLDRIHRLFFLLNLALGLALFGLGYAIDGWAGGWSVFLWAFCMRAVLVWHSTWFVNSATHLWGYRNYETPDNSRNTWWVALLTFGEGWHNNHHADQRSAAHGHRWFEIDPTYLVIRLLERVGLAWDVVVPRHRERMSRVRKAA